MNSFAFRQTCSLVTTVALMIVSSILSVRAETAESSPHQGMDSPYPWQNVSTSAESLKSPGRAISLDQRRFPSTPLELNPTPDTGDRLPATPPPNLAQQTVPPPDAPTEPLDIDTTDVSPGRTTRSGSSYIGIGGNIGVGDGDTALGEGSFAVFSKIGLTSNVSVRPSVLIEDNPTILLPVTLDFTPAVTDVTVDVTDDLGARVSPYVGAGIAISTGDDSSVDFLATGGVDVPLTTQVTATASLSASLFDDPAIGLLVGVGYNFQ